MQPEVLRNQYDLREAAFSLAVGAPFAIAQWMALRNALAFYDVPGRQRSVLWIPVTGLGIAAMIFLMPSGMPLLFMLHIAKPMLPAIAALALAQWLVLRWLIRASFTWFLITAVGGTAAVFLAEMGALVAGPVGWALVFGATIGIMQAPFLMRALEKDWRQHSPPQTSHLQ